MCTWPAEFFLKSEQQSRHQRHWTCDSRQVRSTNPFRKIEGARKLSLCSFLRERLLVLIPSTLLVATNMMLGNRHLRPFSSRTPTASSTLLEGHSFLHVPLATVHLPQDLTSRDFLLLLTFCLSLSLSSSSSFSSSPPSSSSFSSSLFLFHRGKRRECKSKLPPGSKPSPCARGSLSWSMPSVQFGGGTLN